MRLEFKSARRARTRHSEPVILLLVHGTKFAIAASAVDEIRKVEGLQPFTARFLDPKLNKVRHYMERKGKRLFVVDCGLHLAMSAVKGDRLVLLRDIPAAVLVESIERRAEIETLIALPQAFRGAERAWYRGLTIIDEQVIPVLEPQAFVTKGEVAVLQATADKLIKAQAAGATA
jgi:chemotaxis signal transduction protein